MRISVIMPVLNEEQTLDKTLSHSLALGFDEVIVVDGGSGDRTQEIVTSLMQANAGALSLLIASPGRACQMNAGATMSHGDALVFVHADTLLPVNARVEIEHAL